MFCPKCKCEYGEGFTSCADCNVELVDVLPGEMKEKPSKVKTEYTEYELVLSTYKFAVIAQIKSIFEGGDII